MENENITSVDTEEVATEQPQIDANAYIENLKHLREGMVDRAEYERVCENNRVLADNLAKGISYEPTEQKEEVDIDALRKEIFNPDAPPQSNLAYFTKVIEFRDALLERGERDCFLPYNREYVPNEADIEKSNDIARNIKECIEYADGDPAVFNVELQRRCGWRNK